MPDADDEQKPTKLTDLDRRSWKFIAKKTFREFNEDQCFDLAAGLTFYAVLALFPAMLAVVALLGLLGSDRQGTDALMGMVRDVAPGAADTMQSVVTQLTQSHATGFALVIGLAVALWSASGYIGAFGRALNRIYEIEEGRPFYKLRPLMLLITLVAVILAALVALALVVSGPVATAVGNALGIGDTAVTVWNIVKWPVILAVVVAVVAILYYATPNIKQPKFRWISIGAALAVLVWVIASVGFGFYVAHFGSYNKTYGSLAGVIVFLLWLWITNLALLFGAEADSEIERARQLQAGIPAEETLQLPPKDTKASQKTAAADEKELREAQEIRLDADSDPAGRHRQTTASSARNQPAGSSQQPSQGATDDHFERRTRTAAKRHRCGQRRRPHRGGRPGVSGPPDRGAQLGHRQDRMVRHRRILRPPGHGPYRRRHDPGALLQGHDQGRTAPRGRRAADPKPTRPACTPTTAWTTDRTQLSRSAPRIGGPRQPARRQQTHRPRRWRLSHPIGGTVARRDGDGGNRPGPAAQVRRYREPDHDRPGQPRGGPGDPGAHRPRRPTRGRHHRRGSHRCRAHRGTGRGHQGDRAGGKVSLDTETVTEQRRVTEHRPQGPSRVRRRCRRHRRRPPGHPRVRRPAGRLTAQDAVPHPRPRAGRNSSKERAMTMGDRISHAAEEAKGKVKETAGKTIGDERLEAEGDADQASADLKQAGDKLKDDVEDAFRS